MDSKIERLKRLTEKIVSYEILRKSNIEKLKKLYMELEIKEKVEDFEKLFDFKAMNLSGVSLSENELGKIKEGKYIQIIAIYKNDENKMKNINLKYFGRAEKVDKKFLDKIVEFVIRWRLEKSFKNMEHYKNLIKLIEEGKE
ncbi:hypothetical protein [Nitrosophilus labii]|uniref:hypothetical protein n=1 Tax=Nitrosophilus labii TaxID=2706014 RepID=UPI001656CBBE|nr:hypothetical protein [Nitrosophilus labii]